MRPAEDMIARAEADNRGVRAIRWRGAAAATIRGGSGRRAAGLKQIKTKPHAVGAQVRAAALGQF